MNNVYLDNNATTPMCQSAYAAMEPYWDNRFHNPSAKGGHSRNVKIAITVARNNIAALIGAKPSEIYFTGSGTEANNWAVWNAFMTRGDRQHFAMSQVEHAAMLRAEEWLPRFGKSVIRLPVNSNGNLDMEELTDWIEDGTALMSVMLANNVVGNIYPIQKIANFCRNNDVLFHCDAIQAVGKIPIDVKELGVDTMTISAHKFFGPKGIGALYVREGLELVPFIYGGGQEFKMRSGTENVPGIIGMAAAADYARNILPVQSQVAEKRDFLERCIQESVECRVNGDPDNRLPNTTCISFPRVEADNLIMLMDSMGVLASSGSACSAHAGALSSVLAAMGHPDDGSMGPVRFSLSHLTTKDDIGRAIAVVVNCVKKLRG